VSQFLLHLCPRHLRFGADAVVQHGGDGLAVDADGGDLVDQDLRVMDGIGRALHDNDALRAHRQESLYEKRQPHPQVQDDEAGQRRQARDQRLVMRRL